MAYKLVALGCNWLALLQFASAQNNTIEIPAGDGSLVATAGEPLTITWTNPSPGTVTIMLQQDPITPDSGVTLASGVPASDETATLQMPPPDELNIHLYTIEIIDDTDTTNINFSPGFFIQGAADIVGSSSPSSIASSSGSSSTLSSTSTTSSAATVSGTASSATNGEPTTDPLATSSSATPTAQASSAPETHTSTGLPAGAVAGIAVGCSLAGFFSAIVLFFLIRRNRKRRSTLQTPLAASEFGKNNHYINDKQVPELGDSRRRAELSGSAATERPIPELDGYAQRHELEGIGRS